MRPAQRSLAPDRTKNINIQVEGIWGANRPRWCL